MEATRLFLPLRVGAVACLIIPYTDSITIYSSRSQAAAHSFSSITLSSAPILFIVCLIAANLSLHSCAVQCSLATCARSYVHEVLHSVSQWPHIFTIQIHISEHDGTSLRKTLSLIIRVSTQRAQIKLKFSSLNTECNKI